MRSATNSLASTTASRRRSSPMVGSAGPARPPAVGQAGGLPAGAVVEPAVGPVAVGPVAAALVAAAPAVAAEGAETSPRLEPAPGECGRGRRARRAAGHVME